MNAIVVMSGLFGIFLTCHHIVIFFVPVILEQNQFPTNLREHSEVLIFLHLARFTLFKSTFFGRKSDNLFRKYYMFYFLKNNIPKIR